MVSDIESPEILEAKLSRAKEMQRIKDLFAGARCPVCGEQAIKPEITVHQNEALSCGCATVRCRSCGMFNYERHISGYDAYHWKFDGSSELEMLRELIGQTANYLKWE